LARALFALDYVACALNTVLSCYCSSMNLKGAKHSATKKKRDKYLCVFFETFPRHFPSRRNRSMPFNFATFSFHSFCSFSLRIDMDSTLPGNNYRSAAMVSHALCALPVVLSLSRPIVTRRHSKIVLLFNDEHDYNRWNSTLTAVLSSDRLFSRGAC
jgi:hypothetical protein